MSIMPKDHLLLH